MSLALTIIAAGLAAMLIILGAIKLSMWLAGRKSSDRPTSWSDHPDTAWDGSTIPADGNGGGSD